MKICPYCREEVHDAAVKCRYCQSKLPPIEAEDTKQEEDSVTYVVDRDIVRFGKFAGAVLGVFLIFGVYLFGFKLELTLEKARKTQEDIKAAELAMKTAQADLELAGRRLRQSQAELQQALARAWTAVGEIDAQKVVAIELVNSMKDPDAQQVATLQEVKAEQPEKFRPGSGSVYWPNGTTLRIKFLGGNPDKQKAVMSIASEWTKYANIRFEQSDNLDSEVRISFLPNLGSWSFLGTQSLGVEKDQATMNLGWIERKTVLHEFGHALGLIEEHQNPKANIRWNKELVVSYLSGPPNNWDRAHIENTVFKKYTARDMSGYRDFDPLSIMNMTIPKEWTGGLALGEGNELSESDKLFISKIYPRT